MPQLNDDFLSQWEHIVAGVNKTDVPLECIKKVNCNFKFSPQRKPFQGLKAQEVHMNNMRNEYLANSVFDSSLISELHLENSLNFNGFLDLSDTLANGKTLKKIKAFF